MPKLKLDIDPRVDLTSIIDHWCRKCRRVHLFQLDIRQKAYRSMGGCKQWVSFLQLSVEGRLIESKWRGIYRK